MKPRAKVIAVFGSAQLRTDEPRYAQARELGSALAAKGFVVCSGGYGGVMEAVSRGAKEAGGRTLGVTVQFFRAATNPWVDEEIRVKTWKERLFELIKRGHGYVACPGGTGTLVELAVVWEMLNKGAMRKRPLVALSDFWQPVIECMGGIEPVIHTASSPANAAAYLATYFKPLRDEPKLPPLCP
jgi:uncharacterized protein (TIGR00730 family)